ncbi:MAG: DNA primase [Thermodesulfobacteriota bacterium]|nr:DNA primase [Thermodesulfobacteriota bacterium]
MKGHIPEEIIEDIKSRANIVEVVSEYISLKKTGRNFVGLCPFHKEKSPSFTVNPEKQIFYCFGCGEGGNVVTFIMKTNEMTYPEAIRHLAARLGIVIPARKVTTSEKRRASDREKLNRINSMASEYFSKNFSSARGKVARDYMEKRGMDETIIKEFRVGYSLDEWRNLKDYLEKNSVPLALVEKAGLIIGKDNGQFYDRFRGRLIFPIVDLSGNVIAFGGRVLGDGEPKYLNSPETPVYSKGKTLYGLYQTKDDIRRKDFAIIVEGYFDLLSLWGSGIKNVIATLGTALTKNQIELVRRFTRNIVIIFDPDEGGRSAVERSLQLFLEEKVHAKVVVLPDNNDPADFVMEYGREALEDTIVNASSMVDYYIERIIGDRGTLEENIDSIDGSVSFIVNIADPIERNLFIKRVSEKLGADQGLLKTEVARALKKTGGVSGGREPERSGIKSVDAVELSLIYMMCEYPEKIPLVIGEKTIDYFVNSELKNLGQVLVESFEEDNGRGISDIVNDIDSGIVKEKLLKMMVEKPSFDEGVIDRVFEDTLKKIRAKWYKNRHKILKRELARAQEMGDKDLSTRLLMEKGKLLKEEKRTYQ